MSASQNWAIAAVSLQPAAVTLAKLSSFTATESSGGVSLRWQTGDELNNLGFNVYREQRGKRTRINPEIIAGSGLLATQGTRLTAGQSYGWQDRAGKGKDPVQYWLEDIDLDGTRTLHGPITATADDKGKPSGREQSLLLSDLQGLQPERPSAQGYPAAQLQHAVEQQPQAIEPQSDTSPAPLVTRRALLGRLLRLPDAMVDTAATEGTAREMRSNVFPESPQALQRRLAAGNAVKISVRQAGWYRLTQPELVAAGLGSGVDPGTLQLYADGVEQAILVRGSSQTQFGADASVEFYGKGMDTPASDTRTYWLVAGTESGKRINVLGNQGGGIRWVDNTSVPVTRPQNNTNPAETRRPAGGASAPTAVTTPGVTRLPWLVLTNPSPKASTDAPKTKKKKAVKNGSRRKARANNHGIVRRSHANAQEEDSAQGFPYTWERKDRTSYFSGLLNGEAENFFGPLVLKAAPAKQDLNLTDIDKSQGGTATLEIALQGLTAQEHQVKVMFNGAEVETVTFDALEHPIRRIGIPHSSLVEGNNSLTFTSMNGDADISLVDYVRLTYSHAYRASNDALTFTTKQTAPVWIDGFTSQQVRVFDVTNPAAVEQLTVEVAPKDSGYAVKVSGGSGKLRVLLAVADSQTLHPAALNANEPSAWSGTDKRADFVIITHKDFREAVKPLADLRRSQGLETVVVDVEDIYDEFSYGAHSPEAVRSFLAWAKQNWALAPRYALLFGDATLDPRNYLGFGLQDFVPTKLIDTAQLETSSDDSLADFDNNGLADVAVGRLPVRTVDQAQKVVGKLTAYAPGQPAYSALLVSDRKEGYDFEAASAQVQSLLPQNMTVTVVNRRDNPAEQVRSEVVGGINTGPVLVNYVGHGSSDIWTGAGILNASDATALTNGNRLPLFVIMTCLNGRFQDPFRETLAEALMRADQGGAIAVWASSGLTQPEAQAAMDQQLMKLLFTGSQSPALGDAVRGAKEATSDTDVRRTWILFGDPTMRIR
ncbi:MAG TPA: C25 family cysteine peptidase [Pyrinomonadaceae bacterium]|nr:C25 family cysteine peptidase [Pyrinomonadaceae bacterium]